MGLPTKPTLDYSYTAFQQSQGDNAFPGTEIDNDHANLKTSIDETIDFIGGSFRSDGVLKPSAYPGASDLNAYVATATAAAAAADISATDASASAVSAAAALDSFTDLYLGAKAADPALDNDGAALQDGAIYWNTSAKVLRVYDLGTTTWANGTQVSGITNDTFAGTGVQVDFTLSVSPTTINNTQVYVDGVYIEKSEYTLAGTTLTFNVAPGGGASIQVVTFEQILINVPTDGSVTAVKLSSSAIVDKLGYTPADSNVSRSGIASPSIRTLLAKLSDVADIRDWDAVDLTGANDEASIVQAAINETSGLTNPVPVRFPGCKIALGSLITTKNGTVFEGSLKAGGSYDTKPTWFHITHTGVGFTNENNTGAQAFRRINTYRTQPTPGGGAFTPDANDFDFDWVGAQDITMEDVCLLNPTKAIQIRGRTTGAVNSGRITLKRISGQPLEEGIRATHCLDKVFWDEVDFWTFWSSNANVIARTRAAATAFILGRMDNPKFGRLFSFGYQRGVSVIHQGADGALPTGTVSLLYASCLGMDNCGVAFLVNAGADGATGTIGSLYGASDPANPSISTENLVWCAADGTRFKIDDLFGQYTNGALLALDGTGNIWTVDNARSAHIDEDAGGTPEFSVGAGNTLRLIAAPETSAGTPYGGSGVIETPDWQTFTPSITSGTGTITTIGANTARYRRQGKTVTCFGKFTITTNGTGATDIRISNIPYTNSAIDAVGSGRRDDSGPMLQTVLGASGTTMRIGRYDNAYPGADGAVIEWGITYEAA